MKTTWQMRLQLTKAAKLLAEVQDSTRQKPPEDKQWEEINLELVSADSALQNAIYFIDQIREYNKKLKELHK